MSASQALVFLPAQQSKSSSPESDPDSTTAVHTKSGSPDSGNSHPLTSSEFMTPSSSSPKSTHPGGPSKIQDFKRASATQATPKDASERAPTLNKSPSAPSVSRSDQGAKETKSNGARSLHGNVSAEMVGGKTRLLNKRTATQAKLEDEKELDGAELDKGTRHFDIAKPEVKPKLDHANVKAPFGGIKKRKMRDTDDEGDSEVKVDEAKKEEAYIEEIDSSEADELSDDDLSGEEGASEPDFNPLAEVDVFDYKAQLEDKWNEVQDEMAKELLTWAKGYLEQSFFHAYHCLSMYSKLSKDHQADLRQGIQEIMKEESSQKTARAKLVDFTSKFEMFLNALK